MRFGCRVQDFMIRVREESTMGASWLSMTALVSSVAARMM